MTSIIARLLRRPPAPHVRVDEPASSIPPLIAARLHPDNEAEPLWLKVKRRFKRGKPGVTDEGGGWWVVRDTKGRVAGGARVLDLIPGHPLSIDVAVDPDRRRQGFASQIYRALAEAGIAIEDCSAASLAHCTMTPEGFAFMLARRRRTDPDAEAAIAASASICPNCGPMDEIGRPVQRTPSGEAE